MKLVMKFKCIHLPENIFSGETESQVPKSREQWL